MHKNVMIASVRPTFYEQNMNVTKNWTGEEPETMPADSVTPDGLAPFIKSGGFALPAGDKGGMFIFQHRAEILITEIYFEMGTGASWTLKRVRPVPGGTPVKDTIKSGGTGVTHTKQELPALQVGEYLELVSSGITGGVSRAKIYVRYSDENVH